MDPILQDATNETLFSSEVLTSLQPDDWMIKIDLKSGFYHFRIQNFTAFITTEPDTNGPIYLWAIA
jgi:hypothetical protein